MCYHDKIVYYTINILLSGTYKPGLGLKKNICLSGTSGTGTGTRTVTC
jgi:hypothetical protein